MKRLIAPALLAGCLLAGTNAVHAEQRHEQVLAVTYKLDVSHDESDSSGAGFTVHALAHARMHEMWIGSRYSCRFDPYTLHVSGNGRSIARPMPAFDCGSDQHTSHSFGSFNFDSFPATPRPRWSDALTMSVSEALQWPVDPTVAAYLSPVSWRTDYKSDGRTFVTAHGTGVMLEDRAVTLAGGQLHLHAHLTGTSGMDERLRPQSGQTVSMALGMHQKASLFLQLSNPSTGASISEHDSSTLTATAHSL